jgi:hypothetical protein
MTAGAGKPDGYRVLALAGVADLVLGVALAVAGATGVVPDVDGTVLMIVGLAFAAMGTGLVIWARNKMSQTSGSGGDRN